MIDGQSTIRPASVRASDVDSDMDVPTHLGDKNALQGTAANWLGPFRTAPALWVGLEATVAGFAGKPDVNALNLAAQRAGITNTLGLPIQFVEQATPCSQYEYESHIFHSGHVPTRADHWHDIFNACMWLSYPKLKAALNAVHLRHPPTTDKAPGTAPTRTPASDAATIFDESGAILIGPDPRLANWLIAHDWQSAFVTHRHLWATHHLLVTGHSILEKLATPYPGMIAKVIYQPWQALHNTDLFAVPAGLDQAIASNWQSDQFTRPSQLFALPIMGIPGATADNANAHPSYYDNIAVFRPKRH